MPRQELVFSRQTRRGGSQASRLLSVAPHTLRQAQRHKQQAASSASKQEASTGASLQAARSAATRERCHFWNPTNPVLVVITASFNAAFVVLSKHAFKTRKHRTELGVCQAVFSEIQCQRHSAQWNCSVRFSESSHTRSGQRKSCFVNSEEAEVKVTIKSGRGWRISFSMSALSSEQPLSPAEITCHWRSIGHQRLAHYTKRESWQVVLRWSET